MAIITSTPVDVNNPPVTLAEVKLANGMNYTFDDARLLNLIWQAIDWLEQETGRAWATQSYKYTIDRFPPVMPVYNEWLRNYAQSPIFQYGPWIPMRQRIELPRPPLVSVDSIKYYNTSNVLTTLDPSLYTVLVSDIEWGIIEAATSTSLVGFPYTYIRPDAVQITFTAGPTTIPALFNRFVCEAVGFMNENREGGDVPASLLRAINLLKDGHNV